MRGAKNDEASRGWLTCGGGLGSYVGQTLGLPVEEGNIFIRQKDPYFNLRNFL